ncbi:MAG: REP-associated tyrosine transposase [Anaerolineae bacterium]
MPQPIYRQYEHAPSHLFLSGTAYMVTAGTYEKALRFDTPAKRDVLLQVLFEETARWHWRLQAWAVLANHYHIVAMAPEDAGTLRHMLMALHSRTAIWLNKVEGTPGRRVWFQYWDTCLTFERSYLARLNYVHQNPVRHGLASAASAYPWCSMRWFEEGADPAFQRRVRTLKTDRVAVRDDF